MFEYRQLEALGTVIESGGFDKAADALGLTQSAVTQRVKHLESYVGKPLVIRSNPPVPTDAGIPFYSHFKKMRLLEKDLDLNQDRSEAEQPLSLGINASSLGSWFQPVLGHIMKSTLLDLHVGEAKVVHPLLQQGILAGCISIRKKASRGCYVDYLGDLVLRCVSTRDFRTRYFPQGLTVEGMKSAPAILFHPESQLMGLFQKKVLDIHPFDVPTHIIPPHHEYLQMITEGVAYGFVPESLYQRLQADRELMDLSPMGPIVIPQYWHRWGMESDLLNQVTDRIREVARTSLIQER